jgi:outer membrane protein TolC
LNDLTQAPVAADDFNAASPALPPVDQLTRQAFALRRDVRAIERNTEAAAALEAGARANLRRQVNLSLQTGFSTLYDSPLATIDQVTPVSPVRFLSPVGYSRALGAPWAPFAVVSLAVELPFGNHAARGRLVQAESTLTQSRIRAGDLRRVIGQNVVDAAVAVQRAAAAVESWDAAVGAARQSLDAAIQRFRLGDVTLIDVLLTEQELTENLQQRVSGQQVYLSAVARLRFETGTLVGFDGEGTPNEVLSFDARQFVSRP